MKILQGFLMVMGGLAILAVVALITGYVLALLTPDMRASMRPVVLSSEAVDTFNGKLDGLKKEVLSANTANVQRNISLTVTEEEINSVLVMMLAEGTFPAKEMLVNFNDGFLLVYTAWSFPALPAKSVLMGTMSTENGKPKFIIMDFMLGKLPLPGNFDSSVENLLNVLIKLNAPLEGMKVNIKDITVSDGQIKITGATTTTK